MKHLAIIFILISSPLFGQNKLEVSVIYTGENKYIQNPYADDLIHFCTDSIKINDNIYDIDLNSSALKLDLNNLNIPLGKTVNIIIYHKESCKPKILNSMAFPPKTSQIKFDSIQLNEEGVLSWKCYNDSVGVRPPLKIEQLKFNRWTEILEIKQNWSFENHYSAKVELSPGKNIFRINGYSSISDTVCFNSTIKPIGYRIAPNNKMIIFEDSVAFELQSENGLMYFHGQGQIIDLTGLKNGSYQIYYDNEIVKFTARRKKIHWT